jgi:hypothetical protein
MARQSWLDRVRGKRSVLLPAGFLFLLGGAAVGFFAFTDLNQPVHLSGTYEVYVNGHATGTLVSGESLLGPAVAHSFAALLAVPMVGLALYLLGSGMRGVAVSDASLATIVAAGITGAVLFVVMFVYIPSSQDPPEVWPETGSPFWSGGLSLAILGLGVAGRTLSRRGGSVSTFTVGHPWATALIILGIGGLIIAGLIYGALQWGGLSI